MKKKDGLIKRIVVGKPRSGDLSVSDLPHSRRRQFGFLLKTRYRFLLSQNMLTALFFLPSVVWTVLSTIYFADKNAALSASQQLNNLLAQCLYCYATQIPLLCLAFVGLAGSFYCARQLVWAEPCKLVPTFFKGVKLNGKQCAFLGVFVGIICFVLQYSVRFLLLASLENDFARVLGVFLLLLFAVILAIALCYALSLLTTYKLSIKQLIVNCFALTFTKLPTNFLLFCSTFAFLAVVQIVDLFVVKLVFYCVFLTIGLSYFALICTEYAFWVFDIYINAKDYPDFVKKGLSTGEKND